MTYLTFITLLHTAISIIAIPIGIMAVARLFRPGIAPIWTTTFLWFAFLTSATGFIFPFKGATPAFVIGIVALIILIAMWVAHSRPASRLPNWAFSGGMVLSLYLLIFVLVVQAFLKVSVLHVLAPTGSEPAFAITQLVVLVAMVVIGIAALRKYRPAS